MSLTHEQALDITARTKSHVTRLEQVGDSLIKVTYEYVNEMRPIDTIVVKAEGE